MERATLLFKIGNDIFPVKISAATRNSIDHTAFSLFVSLSDKNISPLGETCLYRVYIGQKYKEIIINKMKTIMVRSALKIRSDELIVIRKKLLELIKNISNLNEYNTFLFYKEVIELEEKLDNLIKSYRYEK